MEIGKKNYNRVKKTFLLYNKTIVVISFEKFINTFPSHRVYFVYFLIFQFEFVLKSVSRETHSAVYHNEISTLKESTFSNSIDIGNFNWKVSISYSNCNELWFYGLGYLLTLKEFWIFMKFEIVEVVWELNNITFWILKLHSVYTGFRYDANRN